jgi:hypothetical protein
MFVYDFFSGAIGWADALGPIHGLGDIGCDLRLCAMMDALHEILQEIASDRLGIWSSFTNGGVSLLHEYYLLPHQWWLHNNCSINPGP